MDFLAINCLWNNNILSEITSYVFITGCQVEVKSTNQPFCDENATKYISEVFRKIPRNSSNNSILIEVNIGLHDVVIVIIYTTILHSKPYSMTKNYEFIIDQSIGYM